MNDISPGSGGPFDLADRAAYRLWRQWKLDTAPRDVADLEVGVGDPRALSDAERDALAARCRVANMAVYRGPAVEDKTIPVALGARLGLLRLDANWLADEDGVSSITPRDDGPLLIPYSERPIRWHTDGYYNPPSRRIRGMVLHCVRPAAQGGENALLDPEIAYILLRDEDPAWIRALSAPDAMSIPAREDEDGVARAEETGPVFSLDEAGDLHMRYTARTRSIAWRDDATTRAAVGFLQRTLDAPAGACPWVLRLRLDAGMGLVCNNVLHDRAGFADLPGTPPGRRRLLYRARFLDRIAPTVGSVRLAGARARSDDRRPSTPLV